MRAKKSLRAQSRRRNIIEEGTVIEKSLKEYCEFRVASGRTRSNAHARTRVAREKSEKTRLEIY